MRDKTSGLRKSTPRGRMAGTARCPFERMNQFMARRTLYGTVIVTYRCNAKCNMCDCWRDPSRPEEEIQMDTIRKLPEMAFTNITGGEPFIRRDLPEIVDMNCEDLVPLDKLSDEMGMEFATATLHNSFYFRKTDNKIDDKYHVAQNFEALINELLQSKSPKKWFRAYFNHGLINYIYGNKRLLPCDMSKDAFFIDPFCDVIPCNGMAKKAVMGNLKESPDWDTLWNSEQAKTVRAQTKQCDRNCWMIGSVSPAMHKYIWVPGWWVVKHKFLKGGKYSLSENAFIPEAQKK